VAVASADNFPVFRGNAGASNKRNIPVSWNGSTGQNILWKTEVPLPGNNSPVIWGDKVFLAGANADRQEVYCFDRNSGKILWTTALNPAGRKPQISAETGYAPSTAVTDGTRVYIIFPTGIISALDMDGNKVWEKDLGLPENHYGHASSLIIANECNHPV
jgi:outer membrane protein assembly factor BamB